MFGLFSKLALVLWLLSATLAHAQVGLASSGGGGDEGSTEIAAEDLTDAAKKAVAAAA